MIDLDKIIEYLRTELDLRDKTLLSLRYVYQFINRAVPDLTQENFSNYISSLLQTKSKTTVNTRIVAFNHYIDYLDYYSIPHSFRKMHTKKVKTNKVTTYLSAHDIRMIAEARVAYRKSSEYLNMIYHALYLFLGYTGCRISEAVNLKTKDLSLSTGDCWFYDRKNGEDLNVCLSDELVDLLSTLPKKEYVFVNTKGNKLDKNTLRRDVKVRAKMLGIEVDVHPHLFRHSFVSLLLAEDVPLDQIGLLTGHSKIDTLFKTYAHLLNKNRKEIINHKHPLALDYLSPEDILRQDLEKIRKLRIFNDPRFLAKLSEGKQSVDLIVAIK